MKKWITILIIKIICTVATAALAADDVIGIGAADDPAIGATVSGIAKGAQMVFGW